MRRVVEIFRYVSRYTLSLSQDCAAHSWNGIGMSDPELPRTIWGWVSTWRISWQARELKIPVNVVFADDHALSHRGLQRLLQVEKELRVPACRGDGKTMRGASRNYCLEVRINRHPRTQGGWPDSAPENVNGIVLDKRGIDRGGLHRGRSSGGDSRWRRGLSARRDGSATSNAAPARGTSERDGWTHARSFAPWEKMRQGQSVARQFAELLTMT